MSDSWWHYGLIAHQAPLSVGFSRQEYWSGLPYPSPGHLPDQGMERKSPAAPAGQADSLLLSHQGSPSVRKKSWQISRWEKQTDQKLVGGWRGWEMVRGEVARGVVDKILLKNSSWYHYCWEADTRKTQITHSFNKFLECLFCITHCF